MFVKGEWLEKICNVHYYLVLMGKWYFTKICMGFLVVTSSLSGLWLCISFQFEYVFFFLFKVLTQQFVISWRFCLFKYSSAGSDVTSDKYFFHLLPFSNRVKMWALGLQTVFQCLTRRLTVSPPLSLLSLYRKKTIIIPFTAVLH